MFDSTIIYYNTPCQALFLRPDIEEPTYEQGIIYRHNIIAARDGKVFTTWQVLNFAHDHCIEDDYAIVEGDWKPFSFS